jgi:hypothetical protein
MRGVTIVVDELKALPSMERRGMRAACAVAAGGRADRATGEAGHVQQIYVHGACL